MNKSVLPLLVVVAMMPLAVIAHPGHDGISSSDSGVGYSLVHYLLSNERLSAILLGLVIAIVAGAGLRRLRRAAS
jgi:hypothetical protein